jgi:1,4-alpha-glucan branching enzyme
MKEMDQETETGIVHVKNGLPVLDTYVWQHDRQPLPDNPELVIYEMHLADFAGGEIGVPDKLKRATEKLDYLADLGVNEIELLPVTEYAGDYRWGYLVRYYFALESSYGTPEDFKHFVDECHARGIRVIIDGIYHHTDDQSPLLYLDRNYWYYRDRHYPEDDANYWGPEFNYDAWDAQRNIKPAWNFIADVVRFWIQEYHIDGIRYDAIRQLANYEFLDWLLQQANDANADKPFYHIAEHIPDSSEIVKPDGCFDACWHESFRYFLKDALMGEEFDWEKLKQALDPRQQGYVGVTSVINYLATHDREHMTIELQQKGITGAEAMQRIKLGVAIQMTAPGVPLVWMGDEFGECCQKTKQTTEPNPIHWNLLQNDLNRDLFAYYQRMIALRKTNIALHTDEIEFFHDNPIDKVLAYQRWNNAGDRVVVVANLGDRAFSSYQIANFPTAENWYNWLEDSRMEVQGSALCLELPPYTAQVFVAQ